MEIRAWLAERKIVEPTKFVAGAAPLIDDTLSASVERIVRLIKEDIYPTVPRPWTVEANKEPLAEKVETKDAVLTYPTVPRPWTVDVIAV